MSSSISCWRGSAISGRRRCWRYSAGKVLSVGTASKNIFRRRKTVSSISLVLSLLLLQSRGTRSSTQWSLRGCSSPIQPRSQRGYLLALISSSSSIFPSMWICKRLLCSTSPKLLQGVLLSAGRWSTQLRINKYFIRLGKKHWLALTTRMIASLI